MQIIVTFCTKWDSMW